MSGGIGETYRAKAVQAVIGPTHSTVIPEVLWGAWLDSSMDVLGVAGPVPHEAFGATATGVVNVQTIDGGIAGSGWTVAWFALLDAQTSGAIVALAAVTATPTEDDPMVFAPGTLAFTYTEDP